MNPFSVLYSSVDRTDFKLGQLNFQNQVGTMKFMEQFVGKTRTDDRHVAVHLLSSFKCPFLDVGVKIGLLLFLGKFLICPGLTSSLLQCYLKHFRK